MAFLRSISLFIDHILPTVVFLLMGYAIYYIFNVAPDEVVMGAVQRILYFHVGSASSTYLALTILFVSSVWYLAEKDEVRTEGINFPLLGRASAVVGFVFASIVLITGMIWGYSSWNTWWRWEPRLASVLILWIFLLSYLYVSVVDFKRKGQGEVVCSVLGILSSIQVPIVIYSIKFLDRTRQLHPEVVGRMGLKDPRYSMALILATVSLLLFTVILIRIQYRVFKVQTKVRQIREERIYGRT